MMNSWYSLWMDGGEKRGTRGEVLTLRSGLTGWSDISSDLTGRPEGQCLPTHW